MRKMDIVWENALSDLRNGKYGKIGEKYLTLREFCEIYEISYRYAVRIFDRLKTEQLLVCRNNAHYVNDSDAVQTGSPAAERMLLGLHVRDISNAFYAELCSALNVQANALGFDIVMMSSDNDNKRKRDIFRRFLKLGCAGVINLNSLDEAELTDFYRLYSLPIVTYGLTPVPGLAGDFVVTDNALSGRQAAKHLLDVKCESFVYVVRERVTRETDERLNGFSALLPKEPEVVVLPEDMNDANRHKHVADKLFRLARTGKLGVFCHHDLLAMMVLKLLETKKLRVPDEVAVIGYDDLTVTQYTTPTLTGFSYSFQKIAAECLDLLQKRIGDRERPQSVVVIPTTLFIRNSSKAAPKP